MSTTSSSRKSWFQNRTELRKETQALQGERSKTGWVPVENGRRGAGVASDRVVLRWVREGSQSNSIERVGNHGLTDWISTASQRVGDWVVRSVATNVEASRVVH